MKHTSRSLFAPIAWGLLLSFGINGCSSNGPSDSGSTSTQSTTTTTSSGTGGSSGSSSSGTGGSNGGSSSGTGSSTSGSSMTMEVVTLNQTGNPIYAQLTSYTSWLSTTGDTAAQLAADKTLADNVLTWQMPHGGFYKETKVYSAPWNGTDARSGWFGANNVELGTIDNDATVIELLFLADVHRRSGEAKYRDGARKALDFLLTMQYPSGGFSQVHPPRVGATYSNHVTFNDDAMARVMILLDQVVKLKQPLDGDLFTDDQRSSAATAIAKGIDFILKAQMPQNGVKTVWCAQHDPVTYEPRGARSYELESRSGKESGGIVAFLMSQPQTAEVKAAVQAAIAWYRSSKVMVKDTAYVKRPAGNNDDTYNPIRAQAGSTMWYRFYDLNQDVGFFSGRLPTDNPPGAGKKYDIMEIEPERRYGYEWGGGYGTKLLIYATNVGY